MLSDSYYKDISLPCDSSEVRCMRMTYCYCCILSEKKHSHRLSYDVASAYYNSMLSVDLCITSLKKLDNTCRCTGLESSLTQRQSSYAFRMESVYVLIRADSLYNLFLIDLLRKRKLYENSVAPVICIKLIDKFIKLFWIELICAYFIPSCTI